MNLLITGAFKCSSDNMATFEEHHDICFMQNESDALPCDPVWPDGIICNGLFLHHDIKKFTSLKFIQLTSAGLDRVPLNYIKENGIKIYNAGGVYSIPMAEFAIGGVLQLYKQAPFFLCNQKERRWEKNRNLLELFGKTVCIVGCGSVGNECAKRFSAFGCELIGIDLFPRNDELYFEMFGLDKLGHALSRSDIVVLTLPLTHETKHIMNSTRFSQMKNGSVLVNISRGGVVNTHDLTEALKNRLGGAVLDVFEEEPLGENSSLWDMKNVIITPHNSFVGEMNSQRLFECIYNNIKDFEK